MTGPFPLTTAFLLLACNLASMHTAGAFVKRPVILGSEGEMCDIQNFVKKSVIKMCDLQILLAALPILPLWDVQGGFALYILLALPLPLG